MSGGKEMSPKRRRLARLIERWSEARAKDHVQHSIGGIKATDLDELVAFAQAVLADGTLMSVGGEDVS